MIYMIYMIYIYILYCYMSLVHLLGHCYMGQSMTDQQLLGCAKLMASADLPWDNPGFWVLVGH